MPITEQAVKQEWSKIIIMARNNGFPEQTVHKLRNKLKTKRDWPLQTQLMQQHNKRWATFTYDGPSVRSHQFIQTH
jgi:predicted neuraminidase